jgi:phosphoribosylformylglycinamidine synthase I
MKFGVVLFPGSNCDNDMVHVLANVLGQEVVKLWHKSHDLEGCEAIVLPGGFSYGDYLRTGAIARFSPIMQEVVDFASKGGLVVGICNGFQILAEAGLVPGVLLRNSDQRYVCRNIYLQPVSSTAPLTKNLEKRPYAIPIAHGEGRYFADEDTLKSLEDHDQILFQYVDATGRLTEEANPNGSVRNIAGISNKQKNVVGMMPHPERASEEALGNTDGRYLLESLIGIMAYH